MKEQKIELWNRNFIQCCFSYFLLNLSHQMLVPTMPLYLEETLHIDPAQIGIILSSYAIGLLVVRPMAGFLVDYLPRKKLYLISSTLFALTIVGYWYATSMGSIIALRILQGIFMGAASVSGNTIAVDVVPSSRRSEGMGFYGVATNLAMTLAPVGAIFAYERFSFTGLVTVVIIIATLATFSVSQIKVEKKPRVIRPTLSLDRFILIKALPAALSFTLISIPYGMLISFVVLYGGSIGVNSAGYFFISMAIGTGCARLISGKLVDKGWLHSVAISAISLLTVALLIFSTIENVFVFYACGLVIGTSYGISVPAFQTLFVNVAPSNQRGTATSTYLSAFDLGVGLGMLIAGYIAQYAELHMIYIAGAGFSLTSLLFYILKVRDSYNKQIITK